MYKLNTDSWSIKRLVFLMAGVFVLVTVILGLVVSNKFLYLTGLVGLMQIIFALTGFCPLAIFLSKVGFKSISENKF